MNPQSLYDFYLPQQHIALRPAIPREAARLMAIGSRSIRHHSMRHLAHDLRKGDHVVLNDTKVLPFALKGTHQQRAFACLLLEEADHPIWRSLIQPSRHLKEGMILNFGEMLFARFIGKDHHHQCCLLQFQTRHKHDLKEHILRMGKMPLPPYIAHRRPADDQDTHDYQTLFARREGSIAAPTAGLHITPSLIQSWRRQHIRVTTLTLHVGRGTFLPMRTSHIQQHAIHKEWGEVTPQAVRAINDTIKRGGRIIAVGTTSLRLLETAARSDGWLHPFRGETNLFITPHHRFRVVHRLLTNFHLPRSTLFVLVAAFAGLPVMQRAYALARTMNYRFYSYGDGCLIERKGRFS